MHKITTRSCLLSVIDILHCSALSFSPGYRKRNLQSEKYSSAVHMRNYLFLYIVAMTTLITLKAVIIFVSGSYFVLVVSGLILYNMGSHIL